MNSYGHQRQFPRYYPAEEEIMKSKHPLQTIAMILGMLPGDEVYRPSAPPGERLYTPIEAEEEFGVPAIDIMGFLYDGKITNYSQDGDWPRFTKGSILFVKTHMEPSTDSGEE